MNSFFFLSHSLGLIEIQFIEAYGNDIDTREPTTKIMNKRNINSVQAHTVQQFIHKIVILYFIYEKQRINIRFSRIDFYFIFYIYTLHIYGVITWIIIEWWFDLYYLWFRVTSEYLNMIWVIRFYTRTNYYIRLWIINSLQSYFVFLFILIYSVARAHSNTPKILHSMKIIQFKWYVDESPRKKKYRSN